MNIAVKDLAMTYGNKLLFTDVNLLFQPGRRYGLVGGNGAGKSTFIRLIAGEETPTLGEVLIAKQCSIGWMRQDQFSFDEESLVNVVIRGNSKLWEALAAKDKLLMEEWTDESGYRLGELEETIAHYDGYRADAAAQVLLEGLGIPSVKHFDPLRTLSGGYKLRVLLAQALFENPDVLLLDEPNNHLDIMTIAWLESYLVNTFKGVLLVISHDVDFLNNICTDMLDIDYGEIRNYVGNYDYFVKEKTLVVEQKMSQRANAEKKIDHLQSFVERFKAKASKAKQAQSRMKMIEKIEVPDLDVSSRISPTLNFQQQRPSGKIILTVDKLSKAYGSKQVLCDVTFELQRGEKLVIIGPNGIGKSTLLKCLQGIVAADSGHYEWGYEAAISYFAQDHHEQLHSSLPMIEWLSQQITNQPTLALRSVLGQVLFSKEEAEKKVDLLSGGEAARLLLGKIILEKPNVLILDEPTNHLDLEAVEALAEALQTFPGTMICVSHNRHFVTKIATRVIALSEHGMLDFLGPYSEYLDRYGSDFLNRGWLETADKADKAPKESAKVLDLKKPTQEQLKKKEKELKKKKMKEAAKGNADPDDFQSVITSDKPKNESFKKQKDKRK